MSVTMCCLLHSVICVKYVHLPAVVRAVSLYIMYVISFININKVTNLLLMVIPICPIPAVVRSSASHLCKNKYIRRYICDHGLREINTHMYMDTRGGAPRSLQIPSHFLIQPPPTMKEVRTYVLCKT